MRQLWGTFSVRDHIDPYPFVEDVLMYDRLVLPYPGDPQERRRWEDAKWNPDRLDEILSCLGTEGEEGKRHAVKVDWNEYRRQAFDEKQRMTAAVGRDLKPYRATREILAEEFRAEADGVTTRVDAVAAYRNLETVERDWVLNQTPHAANDSSLPEKEKSEKRAQLTLAVAHEFLVPDTSGKDELEALKEAVDLANDSKFQKKRSRMLKWQETILSRGLEKPEAVEEMQQYISDYNAAIETAVKSVYKKFAFTLIPIAMTAIGGPLAPAAGAGAIMNLVKFWVFDRKPKVEAGEAEVAAMFHYVHEKLGWHARLSSDNASSQWWKHIMPLA